MGITVTSENLSSENESLIKSSNKPRQIKNNGKEKNKTSLQIDQMP